MASFDTVLHHKLIKSSSTDPTALVAEELSLRAGNFLATFILKENRLFQPRACLVTAGGPLLNGFE